MNWIPEINNINQLIGFIADIVTLVGILGIGIGCLVIYKKVINISITYYNFLLIYSKGINNELRHREGFWSGLRNVKVK